MKIFKVLRIDIDSSKKCSMREGVIIKKDRRN
jgi:hypothetical protein